MNIIVILTISMSSIFGISKLEKPSYTLLKKFDKFEIRQYDAMNLVFTNKADESKDFQTLANYIGVMKKPQNEENKSIPMSAPVIWGPLISEEPDRALAFYVPDKYEPLPKPFDDEVKIARSGDITMAVMKFSGRWNPDNVGTKVQEL